ncbi:urease [Photobacterium jeanii]|uniref:Urease n=1 Tax=Photobacterium jeanii TaxID=858640 RepID=A0A178K306_9GAMM|nr:urease [Photobacterium jeanii]
MKHALLTGGLLSSGLAFHANAASPQADIIFTNANLYQAPSSQAIVVHQGRFVFIGDTQAAMQYQGEHTETIDLEGAFVMPGFVDNHNHIFEAASDVGGNCELGMDASLEEQIPFLEYCRKQAKDKSWIMGYGFTLENILNEDNNRTPLAVLDSIFPDQPVVLMEQTSHSMWVNSMALKKAGITLDTPQPQGGRILRDEETGELNGILLDNAGDLVMEMAWNGVKDKFNQSYEGLMNGLDEARSHGITTVGDGRLYWKRGWLDVWQEAEQNGDLTARVSLRPWIYPTEPMKPQLAFLKDIQSKEKTARLVIDQVKMYSDGIFVNGTAKTLAPYLATYIEDSPYGLNYIPEGQMENWLTELDKIGYGAHIHAIGDGAIRESLNAVEHARKMKSQRDYTLTHVELVNSKDIPRFKALDVTADFQVGSDYVAEHDHSWAEAFLGKVRARSLMQVNRLYQAGANISLSSDWNVHDINPLVGIANSLLMDKSGLPDIDTAIAAYTINPAKSLGLADEIGTIEVGKSADLVVLDKDITNLKPENIPNAQVLMTVLQGEIIFDIDDEE